jgi:hypothetical protein
MVALFLWLFLWQHPGAAGVELDPTDPQGTNYATILECLRSTPWTFNPATGPSGGCAVTYKPGTYYLQKPIVLPNGVVDVYFRGVSLYPCADMGYMIGMSTMGPAPGALLHDFAVDPTQACGTFQPNQPYFQVAIWN